MDASRVLTGPWASLRALGLTARPAHADDLQEILERLRPEDKKTAARWGLDASKAVYGTYQASGEVWTLWEDKTEKPVGAFGVGGNFSFNGELVPLAWLFGTTRMDVLNRRKPVTALRAFKGVLKWLTDRYGTVCNVMPKASFAVRPTRTLTIAGAEWYDIGYADCYLWASGTIGESH